MRERAGDTIQVPSFAGGVEERAPLPFSIGAREAFPLLLERGRVGREGLRAGIERLGSGGVKIGKIGNEIGKVETKQTSDEGHYRRSLNQLFRAGVFFLS